MIDFFLTKIESDYFEPAESLSKNLKQEVLQGNSSYVNLLEKDQNFKSPVDNKNTSHSDSTKGLYFM